MPNAISPRCLGAALAGLLLVAPATLPAQGAAPTPVLLDTDIGTDIGDAFALGMILASPELDLRGITTVSGDTQQRALLVCRFLTATGRRHKTVAAGEEPQPPGELGGQYQYYYHPDVIFNRTRRPEKDSAVPYLLARLRGQAGKVTLLATGPLTNVARLLGEKPESKSLIRRIILTGGSIPADVPAARAVLGSGVPLVVIPPEPTAGLTFDAAALERVFAPNTPLTWQMQTLYQLWDKKAPPLDALLAVALALDERFCTFEERHLEVDGRGTLVTGKGKPTARVVTGVRRDAFLDWAVGRLASCLPPFRKPARPVERGAFPYRVHVAEDYDTDIERRWWMSGKAETGNLPPGSSRACRGVLTHDFDDLLGHTRAMYTAVVFNPVPGPPMGKSTRLSFRYWLRGTDTLRVQIYSLTNGYHRHLVLRDLPEGRWQEATVDMTAARRPDGTGGPLSEGERIDDIQFYAEPTAELIIDDIVLFDAASPGEKRPFPRHIHFAGGFDSGKQGKEWPGAFEIVPEKGYFWRAAASVTGPEAGRGWIRLHLRGERPMGAATRLTFRYRLTGAREMQVLLRGTATGKGHTADLKKLEQGTWAQATADFTTTGGERVDEVHFLLPPGAGLLLDDVVLYEPGK